MKNHPLSGREDLHGAADDERSERTRSVPSVASRRVAAPSLLMVWMDDLALERSISSKKCSNLRRATRAKITPDYVELATLAEPAGDGHLQACKFSHLPGPQSINYARRKKNLRPEDHTRYQVAKRRETT